MSRQREWTRTVLEILRHDATLVALVVAFVVLCVGVFGILQRENAAPRAASIARVDVTASDSVQLIVAESSAADSETAFVPELVTDTPSLEPALRVFEGVIDQIGR